METVQEIALDFWRVLSDMAPYLLFGFFVAGVLSVVISPRLVERHLGGRGIWPVVKAAAFGVPLPLCSCGVIPVSASLRRHGASKGAVTGFLVSTPQTGVDSILVTYGLLGPVMAIFRPIAALVSGVIGGGVVAATDGDGHGARAAPEQCEDACCVSDGHGLVRRMLSYGFVTLARDLARPLLLGLAAAALISALVPKDFFASYLGSGVGAILILMILGIPVYVCATASVPVAFALIARGVSPGAAFAFLVTGPATNAATLAVIWRVLGRRTAVIYLATVAISAVAGGLVLDHLVTAKEVSAGQVAGWMIPDPVKWASAAVLLGVLGAGLLKKEPAADDREHEHEDDHDAPEDAEGSHASHVTTLRIVGMTCSHCAASVERALGECEGVASAVVDLAAKEATVSGGDYDAAALRAAVEGLGYRIEDSPPPRRATGGEEEAWR